MRNSNLIKLLSLFGCSVLSSIIVYLIVGLVISYVENGYASNSASIRQLDEFNRQLHQKQRTIQTMDSFRFYIPLLIFFSFAVFAIKPTFELTKSYFLSFLIITFFVGFPIIFLIVSIIIFVAINGIHII